MKTDHEIRDLVFTAVNKKLSNFMNTDGKMCVVDSPSYAEITELALSLVLPEIRQMRSHINDLEAAVYDYQNADDTQKQREKELNRRLANYNADLSENLKEADDIILNFVEIECSDCRLDHHGYCQEHFLEEDCTVKRAKEYLKKREATNVATECVPEDGTKEQSKVD